MQSIRPRPADASRVGAVPKGRCADAGLAPAWRLLLVPLMVVLALWAAGIVELPESNRRFADWIGALSVVTILMLWVRRNGSALAYRREPTPTTADPVRVRLIRSRRPPVAEIGGPGMRLPRRTPAHRRRS
jgi:hypothetical protein